MAVLAPSQNRTGAIVLHQLTLDPYRKTLEIDYVDNLKISAFHRRRTSNWPPRHRWTIAGWAREHTPLLRVVQKRSL